MRKGKSPSQYRLKPLPAFLLQHLEPSTPVVCLCVLLKFVSNLYICVCDLCVCACDICTYVCLFVCMNAGTHTEFCGGQTTTLVSILALHLFESGLFAGFQCVEQAIWLMSSQAISSLCLLSHRHTGIVNVPCKCLVFMWVLGVQTQVFIHCTICQLSLHTSIYTSLWMLKVVPSMHITPVESTSTNGNNTFVA